MGAGPDGVGGSVGRGVLVAWGVGVSVAAAVDVAGRVPTAPGVSVCNGSVAGTAMVSPATTVLVTVLSNVGDT